MDTISLLTLGPAAKSPFYAETVASSISKFEYTFCVSSRSSRASSSRIMAAAYVPSSFW